MLKVDDSLSNPWALEHPGLMFRPSGGHQDIAQKAYENALNTLKDELKGDKIVNEWLRNPTSMHSLQQAIHEAQQKYNITTESRRPIWKAVSKLFSRITYYSDVLNMLAQHHPEYVALAWGAFKFVLVGVINHEKMVTKLADTIAEIGDILPRTKLNAELYQTKHMEQALSRLYAQIISLFQQAVLWYNRSPIRRALQAIVHPFDLDCRDIKEQIKICSDAIEDIANACQRTEIRDMHIMLQLQQNAVRELDSKLERIQERQEASHQHLDSHFNELLQVAVTHKAIIQRVDTNVLDMQPRVYELQFSSVLNHLRPPMSPRESLKKSQSLARRSRASRPDTFDLSAQKRILSRWLSGNASSLFLVKSALRAETIAKEIILGVISAIQSTTTPILYFLASPPNARPVCSDLADMLTSFVFQALQYNPETLIKDPDKLSINRFKDSHSDSEWVELLGGILANMPSSILVIELSNIQRDDSDFCQRILRMANVLSNKVSDSGRIIKILIGNFGRTESHTVIQEERVTMISLQAPRIIPQRLKHQRLRNQRPSNWWKGLEHFVAC